MEKNIKTNQLICEKSPYLLQHAHNPVNWYPWGEEAFEKAAQENKPIFLSIGYSTCHWCHVMAHESFEDEVVADLLNRYFVCVKVDREERPDVDAVYMKACQMLTGRGGWPLSVFMTPNKQPFFTGTYFPKLTRDPYMGFIDLCEQIHTQWETNHTHLSEIAIELTQALSSSYPKASTNIKDNDLLDACFQEFAHSFDATYGGFGSAPKFPSPHTLLFLLRYGYLYANPTAMDMVFATLNGMYRGGLFDHLGGGFSRYSTDAQFLVPHFEKMLYDNALLLITYTEAYQLTRDPVYQHVIEHTIDYLSREMASPAGGFYSAQDADSEGVEGKFYLFTKEEVLREINNTTFCDDYNISESGNFEGKNIPNLIKNTGYRDMSDKYAKERKQLFTYRNKRIPPHTDDKQLTAWNGLMIAALSFAGTTFNRLDWLALASNAHTFIESDLIKDHTLFARYRDGQHAYIGYLTDYVYMLWGTLQLFESTNDAHYLTRCNWYADQLIDLFWDTASDGFLFSNRSGETLIVAIKEGYDNALPSGNAVAAYCLIRLGLLTSNTTYTEYGEKTIEAFKGQIANNPSAFSFILCALMHSQTPYHQIKLSGDANDYVFKQSKPHLSLKYAPFAFKEISITSGPTQLALCDEHGCAVPKSNADEIMAILTS
jgi:uncharacterized protein YyaL (SSP411 family)